MPPAAEAARPPPAPPAATDPPKYPQPKPDDPDATSYRVDGDTPSHLPPPVGPGAAAPVGSLPQVPGYELLGRLGRGGMGIVYQARHLKLNRLVALKMMRAEEADADSA